jgi:hypothetical protein
MFLLNTKTQEFPLGVGDIPIYEPNWTEADPIPDYFVEVEIAEFPVAETHQIIMSNLPALIDGKWVQTHYVRNLTDEEIAATNAHKEGREEWRANHGLLPELRLRTIDENGKIILNEYGQTYVEPVPREEIVEEEVIDAEIVVEEPIVE